jgi:hypothetical protein
MTRMITLDQKEDLYGSFMHFPTFQMDKWITERIKVDKNIKLSSYT